jgi:hypothetical protein
MGEDTHSQTLKIGQLARQFGLNVRTLRHYEMMGLLAASQRAENRYRLNSAADVEGRITPLNLSLVALVRVLP